jgi:hypothetical protein
LFSRWLNQDGFSRFHAWLTLDSKGPGPIELAYLISPPPQQPKVIAWTLSG